MGYLRFHGVHVSSYVQTCSSLKIFRSTVMATDKLLNLLVVFMVCCFFTHSRFVTLSCMFCFRAFWSSFVASVWFFLAVTIFLDSERAASALGISVGISVRGFFYVLISLLLVSAVTFQVWNPAVFWFWRVSPKVALLIARSHTAVGLWSNLVCFTFALLLLGLFYNWLVILGSSSSPRVHECQQLQNIWFQNIEITSWKKVLFFVIFGC